MRTSEEIRQWARVRVTYAQQKIDDPTEQANLGFWLARRNACLDLVCFIDSPPPCKHPNAQFYLHATSYLRGIPVLHSAIYCPDCGEKLKEKD